VKIKICGLFREEDIDYVNEARPDYAGFVFAECRRQVTAEQASRLRRRLAECITPVGVFIDAPIESIAALYRDRVINIAQLHGGESEEYIIRLKEASGDTPVPVIKVIKSESLNSLARGHGGTADYYLFDSGAGSGKPFNWNLLNLPQSPVPSPLANFVGASLIDKPWFLAGGIQLGNIEQAMTLGPFGIDVSSGAETDGVKDREKILRLTEIVRRGNKG
jgi:phosphoribosylanthranilate isomerase